jgi:hypothetical protein
MKSKNPAASVPQREIHAFDGQPQGERQFGDDEQVEDPADPCIGLRRKFQRSI